MAGIYAGISGWRYTPWRKAFYPEGLAQRLELHYASRHMASIEINSSFYSLQRLSSWEQWRDDTPDGFLFSVKCPRFITHLKRLRDIEAPLGNFFASGVLALKDKLGPLLWQFPPNFSFDAALFDEFFAQLPHDYIEAAAVGRRHDEKLRYPEYLEVDKNRKLRHAIEIRNNTFMVPKFFELLRKHDVAFVFADTAGKWPYAEEVTSKFCYLRLHGDQELYVSGYTDKALHWWAARVKAWHEGRQPPDATRVLTKEPPRTAARDVFIYFDNDVKVHAPFDALTLMKLVGKATPLMLQRLEARYAANPDIHNIPDHYAQLRTTPAGLKPRTPRKRTE